MKKVLILSVMVIFSLFAVSSAFAKPAKCPQPRKTKAAPGSIGKKKIPASADAKNGKLIYTKKAKPMACKMCHGDKGDGGGKLGAALKPAPRNFACAATMKKVSAGQMFHIIKNGSKGTGMVAHGKTLKDKEIWDVVKYVRSTFMK
jgi:mono/diheme cytochrome c family protein